MDSKMLSILDEIDTMVALGEYMGRANQAATGSTDSPATHVIARRIATLYGEILLGLGDKAEAAVETRQVVADNISMGKQVYAAARRGIIPQDKAASILQFLIADSTKKVSDLEVVYG